MDVMASMGGFWAYVSAAFTLVSACWCTIHRPSYIQGALHLLIHQSVYPLMLSESAICVLQLFVVTETGKRRPIWRACSSCSTQQQEGCTGGSQGGGDEEHKEQHGDESEVREREGPAMTTMRRRRRVRRPCPLLCPKTSQVGLRPISSLMGRPRRLLW